MITLHRNTHYLQVSATKNKSHCTADRFKKDPATVHYSGYMQVIGKKLTQ
jgi:hypothetical protein